MPTFNEPHGQAKPFALLLIALACIGGGALIGASTNAINGTVSPEYFRAVMGWPNVEATWRAAIAQGVFEGLIYGVMFSIAFSLVVGIVSHGECSFATASPYLLAIVFAIYLSWALGGLIAIGLATLSPEFYRSTFLGVPDSYGAMMRYAWVGGSIWGAMLGGLLSVMMASILFATNWRRKHTT